ncbi:hypothetical protein C4D60_Mb06t17700 [Musa balbisiana]|uniref:Uncharacterized protein n=1 Tax=Musa balbisiana TaxID=52838 RepID=A0A4S8INR5_MUSBA|nr:hypothetical protein C4D60_Mb06t17700 [Musa balbisiana]
MKPHPIKVLVNASGRSEAWGCSRGCVAVNAVKRTGHRRASVFRVGFRLDEGSFFLGGGHRRWIIVPGSSFNQVRQVNILEDDYRYQTITTSISPRVLRTRRVLLVEGYGRVKPVQLRHCSYSSSWQATMTTRTVIIVLFGVRIYLIDSGRRVIIVELTTNNKHDRPITGHCYLLGCCTQQPLPRCDS